MELNNEAQKLFNIKNFQSVRHLMHQDTMYSIFITNRFRKIGWITSIEGKFYGTQAKMSLKDKDDIIDYYVAMDTNAKQTIEQLCQK